MAQQTARQENAQDGHGQTAEKMHGDMHTKPEVLPA
jgi:hypothetical protein